jgi:TonB family protein
MTLAIAYATLVSAALASAAAVAELLLRALNKPVRWAWAGALALVIPVTGWVMLAPRANDVASPVATILSPTLVPDRAAIEQASAPVVYPWLDTSDRVLGWVWLGASLLLLLAIAAGQSQLVRARRRARPDRVHGHRVLITEDLGPAVAGLSEPVVLLPRWVVALDDASQRLLLAHEVEHARSRDTSLLLGGAMVAALLPWNPVVWWLTWRLRVAVELDCDRRVLAANPSIRQYVDLLLLAAGKNRLAARLFAAHFGEYNSDLERRICAMTETRLRLRPVLATTAISALLLAVACEAPRPDPVAPGLTSATDPASATILLERDADSQVSLLQGSQFPVYPGILREAGIEGRAVVRFVVDEKGLANVNSFEVVNSTHELFSVAVRTALPGMRFKPAEKGGEPVEVRVEQPFTFNIVDATKSKSEAWVPLARNRGQLPDVHVSGISKSGVVELKARPSGDPAVVRRGERTRGVVERPSIVIKSIAGVELKAVRGSDQRVKSAFGEIDPQDIEAIEVYKPAVCPANATVECPMIVITLKRGREAAYRQR